MKYPEGTKFRAEPEHDWQEPGYFEVLNFSSRFNDSQGQIEAEYEWQLLNDDGEEVEQNDTDSDRFHEWVDSPEVTEVDQFPWE